jgi:hypothetical protein
MRKIAGLNSSTLCSSATANSAMDFSQQNSQENLSQKSFLGESQATQKKVEKSA